MFLALGPLGTYGEAGMGGCVCRVRDGMRDPEGDCPCPCPELLPDNVLVRIRAWSSDSDARGRAGAASVPSWYPYVSRFARACACASASRRAWVACASRSRSLSRSLSLRACSSVARRGGLGLVLVLARCPYLGDGPGGCMYRGSEFVEELSDVDIPLAVAAGDPGAGECVTGVRGCPRGGGGEHIAG